MAYLRSACLTILVCCRMAGAGAAERAQTGIEATQPASPLPILHAPPANGSFGLPADRAEAPAPPAAAQAPAAVPPITAAPAQAAAPKKAPVPLQFATVSKDARPTLDPATFVNTMRAAERYHAIAAA